jgi:hypothetical protein
MFPATDRAAATGEEAAAVADYARSIQAEADALAWASTHADLAAAARVVEEVAVSLDLKVGFRHVKMGAGAKMPARVRVIVRTLPRGREESNYLIRFYPAFLPFSNDDSRARIFSRVSSPTSETLVPGTYVAKVYSPSQALVHEQRVQVGAGEDLDQPIDLIWDPP